MGARASVGPWINSGGGGEHLLAEGVSWPPRRAHAPPSTSGATSRVPRRALGVTQNRGPANCGASVPHFCRPLRGVTLSMEDAGKDATRFTAHSLPSDPRLLATVTNAYLGTRVYHETLHVSGVYNGALGDTHRAILPSPLNVQLEAPAGTGEQLTKTYVLDTNTGSHCLPSAQPLPHPPPPPFPSEQKARGPIPAPPHSGCQRPAKGGSERPLCEASSRQGSRTSRSLAAPM